MLLVEEETSRRLNRHVLARVAEVMASDAVQQSLNARLVQERQVRTGTESNGFPRFHRV